MRLVEETYKRQWQMYTKEESLSGASTFNWVSPSVNGENPYDVAHDYDASASHVNRGVDDTVVSQTAAHQVFPCLFHGNVIKVDHISKVRRC